MRSRVGRPGPPYGSTSVCTVVAKHAAMASAMRGANSLSKRSAVSGRISFSGVLRNERSIVARAMRPPASAFSRPLLRATLIPALSRALGLLRAAIAPANHEADQRRQRGRGRIAHEANGLLAR